MGAYLNSVSNMDRRVGIVLAELEKEKLLDDTIIIVFGDNGRVDHRSIHWVYDTGLHVPMIIKWPKNYPAPEGFKPGTVNEEVISLLDLTATTLSLAGVPRPVGYAEPRVSRKRPYPQRRTPSARAIAWMMCSSACDRSAVSVTITSATSNPRSTSAPTLIFIRRQVSLCSRSCATFIKKANSTHI